MCQTWMAVQRNKKKREAASTSEGHPQKQRRKRKCYHWTQKGTKASRALERAARSNAKVMTTLPPVPNEQPVCAAYGCRKLPRKKRYGAGYFLYCYHHRDWSPDKSSAASSSAAKPPASSACPTRPSYPIARVIDVTDHPAAASASREIRKRAIEKVQLMPEKSRMSKGIYAYAEGLHTVMNYPQHYLVSLRGDPAIRNDFTTAPCMITGHTQPAKAVRSTLRHVMNPHTNARSECNHPGCIYNCGDLITRRDRFRRAVAELDAHLQFQQSEHDVYVLTKTKSSDVILDTGAGRNLTTKYLLRNVLYETHPTKTK